jgi:hypothetical protein
MSGMFAVRYVALAALALWLGATITVLAHTLLGDIFRGFDLVATACGAIVFVALFMMKFLGPPPPAFAPRAAIVFLMLAIAAYGALFNRSSSALLAVNTVLGLVLLAWYVTEP